jgi:hypothetical protein
VTPITYPCDSEEVPHRQTLAERTVDVVVYAGATTNKITSVASSDTTTLVAQTNA